jgi:hypothetical protein
MKQVASSAWMFAQVLSHNKNLGVVLTTIKGVLTCLNTELGNISNLVLS